MNKADNPYGFSRPEDNFYFTEKKNGRGLSA